MLLNEAVKTAQTDETYIMYDNLAPILSEVARNNAKMHKLEVEITNIYTSNMNVLLSNLIGEKILINESQINRIFACMDLTEQKVESIYKQSPRFKQVAGLKDQFLFAAPLIVLASELLKIKKKQEAEFIFAFAYLRPYASRVARYFPYGLSNPDRMSRTIEHMENRFFIKKYETIQQTLIQISLTALENYSVAHDWIGNRISDDKLFNDIFSSGIFARVGSIVSKVRSEFDKNEGKYLQYQRTVIASDEDTGEEYGLDYDQGISATRTNLINKVINRYTIEPLNREFVALAVKRAFPGSGATSKQNIETITTFLEKAKDVKFKQMCEIIRCMISIRLSSRNPKTNRNYTVDEIRTLNYFVVMQKALTASNTHDTNILTMKDLINEVLMDCCEKYEYATVKENNTTKNIIKNAAFFYMCLFIQRSAK